jgi:4-amino-4-deoxy-L-arabinose transferase-like glycosyltransferase
MRCRPTSPKFPVTIKANMGITAREPVSSQEPLLQQNRTADFGYVAILLLIALAILLFRNSAVPMQIWDESRNANNAMEMSRNGHLLVTYFHGAPDHWNTKPPLLIWCQDLFLHLGLAPLLAVRLPSILAAMTTVMLVFFFCRNYLADRFAGLIAGLTLLSAPLFVGWHAGRTGDYDSFVTLFTLIYGLAFMRYLEEEGRARTRWIAVAGLAVALSILTKGVGGVLALPGLFLYALFRGRVIKLLLDWRLWLVLLGIAVICGGYYDLRDHFDPGYAHAVWMNEFAGRYLSVNEAHQGGPFYYFWTLAIRFEPGFCLLPLAAIPFFQPDRRRRSVVLLCLLVGAALFLVLTKSKTKIFWYITPATPFLALAVGIGLSSGIAWLRTRGEQSRSRIFKLTAAYAATSVLFGLFIAAAFYYYQFGVERKLAESYMGGRYGPLLEQVRQRGLTQHLVILDYGDHEEAVITDKSDEFNHYRPEALFYALAEAPRGLQVDVATPGSTLPAGSWVATCDPRSYTWLASHYQVAVALQPDRWCEVGRTGDVKAGSSAQ